MGHRRYAFWAQFVFMFAFTKVVKLMGLLRRNPSDVVFLPISIVFGYLHGLIKLYALFTLNMVCSHVAKNRRGRASELTRWSFFADFLGQPG